uniref:Ig-like domain-containing protein n=1 Tax=Anopheles melas TaxID=34690 RepID=A0A182TEJ1_9DIPT
MIIAYDKGLHMNNGMGGMKVEKVCAVDEVFRRCPWLSALFHLPPSVRAIPPTGQVTARKGGAVTLECKASGNPVPSIYWTKRTGTGKSAAKIGEGPVLSLERVERQQAGVYQCTADNNVGEPVTVDMRLDVLFVAWHGFQALFHCFVPC